MIQINDYQTWIPLFKLCLADIPAGQNNSFIYMLRKSDDKEIVYIGETGNLRQRMFKNFIGGTGGGTTQRIHSYLFDGDTYKNIEVTWIESSNRKSQESMLLEEYRLKHGRLPRWNRR